MLSLKVLILSLEHLCHYFLNQCFDFPLYNFPPEIAKVESWLNFSQAEFSLKFSQGVSRFL